MRLAGRLHVRETGEHRACLPAERGERDDVGSAHATWLGTANSATLPLGTHRGARRHRLDAGERAQLVEALAQMGRDALAVADQRRGRDWRRW